MIELEFPRMRYDIALPLFDGRVELAGFQLKPADLPRTLSRDEPRYRTGNFHIAELNVAFWLAAIDAGWELVGLPIFIKRKPLYQYLFYNVGAGINSPIDLAGKRIGCSQYALSTIWLRGLLRHRHRVDLSQVRWVCWNKGIFPIHNPSVHIEAPPDQRKHVTDALIDGDIDVHMADISEATHFEKMETSPSVRRLFPDYAGEHHRLYRDTGIFTHSHVIVMSKELDRTYPELGCQLLDAFDRAKQLAYADILGDQAGFSVLFLREHLRDQLALWGDPWRNGVKANRTEIDAFVQYNHEQGITRTRLTDDQIFAASTQAT